MTDPGTVSSPHLRWALIGASDIAATKVVPALRVLGDSIVAVQSGSTAHGAAFAARYGDLGAIAVTDIADVLARDDVDAVYVSSTNDKHAAQVITAAQAGKHILAEKPLALTVDDAGAMVDAAAAAGVVMATNHHLPASPVHRAAAELVRSGRLGRVLAVRFHHAGELPERLRGWRLADPAAGGVALDIQVHDAAAVGALLGGYGVSVQAIAAAQGVGGAQGVEGVEDSLMTLIAWSTGALVETHDAYNNPHLPTGFQLLGTDAAIEATACNAGDPGGHAWLVEHHKRTDINIPDREDLYVYALREFHSAVAGQGAPMVDGAAGVRSLAVALAAKESVTTGHRIEVRIPERFL